MQKTLAILSLFFILSSANADITVLRVMMDAETEIVPYIASPRASRNRSNAQMDVSVYIRANVTGSPSNPGNVTMSIEWVDDTGGHTGRHRPTSLPVSERGPFDPRSGQMELIHQYLSGRAYFSFDTEYSAPEISGEYRLIAEAGGRSVTRNLHVKIPGLVSLRDYNGAWTLVGETRQHPRGTNHYVTPDAANALVQLARDWETYWNGIPPAERARYATSAGTLTINDCSLQWGGLFDIGGRWQPSHHTHRAGLDTGIRSQRSGGIPIDDLHKAEFEDLVDDEIQEATVELEYRRARNEHYHIDWDGVH